MSTNVVSLSMDDFIVGRKDSIEIPVTIAHIDEFARVSGDKAPLHMDRAFALSQGFSGRVAHGLLLGAYVSQFIGIRLPGAKGVLQQIELSFRQPLIPPDIITIEGVVDSISVAVAQVTIKILVLSQDKRLLASGKVKSIIRG